MAHATRRPAPAAPKPRVQLVATIVAAVFLLLGILGFVPGVTTGYGELAFAGHHSGAELFGVFQVSVLHNLLHLVFGLVGLVLARRLGGARIYLTVGGVLYLALWLYGFAVTRDTPANIVPFNDADSWLHLMLGLGMLAVGLLLSNDAGTGGRLDVPPDRG
ncbi:MULTISPECIES: DUF4383 domain-containing protein [Micromonospora]|uniref:DUF4383 domain-containing protein n=1 Tax=Micromonospora antibiotica TaxID=2807623 RepID=A0ABS3VGC4_9ACTN|nr:DUF4383 domain-containing protein [Micromonospora antibiotica]MBO4164609.1 DUF4383 domain-containing protein [Micromonospora antibiotica]